MNNYLPTTLLLSFALAGCSGMSSEQQSKIDAMSDCEKVTALVRSADNGFMPLKGAEVSSKFMTSWNAKAQLVGDNCKVVETSDGTMQYMCSAQYATEQEAQSVHDEAQMLTQRCLGDTWKASTNEAPRSRTTTMENPQESARILLTLGQGYDKRKPWIVSFKVVRR